MKKKSKIKWLQVAAMLLFCHGIFVKTFGGIMSRRHVKNENYCRSTKNERTALIIVTSL